MKVLRLAVVMMALSGAALFPIHACGQQEVYPDHFDQPAVQSSQKAKPSVHYKATNHAKANHTKLASRHHAVKASHAPANS
jgi:hypothetical protein